MFGTTFTFLCQLAVFSYSVTPLSRIGDRFSPHERSGLEKCRIPVDSRLELDGRLVPERYSTTSPSA